MKREIENQLNRSSKKIGKYAELYYYYYYYYYCITYKRENK